MKLKQIYILCQFEFVVLNGKKKTYLLLNIY